MDENDVPKELMECENLLQDRFKDYLIVALDGDFIYERRSSNAAAMGMVEYVKGHVLSSWGFTKTEPGN